jgi:transcriptional regulator with XRE-family HTH domain
MAKAAALPKMKPGLKAAFGAALRARRMELGMSQDDLAAKSGYQRAYISQVERGLNSPTLGMIFDVCEVLGIRASTLIRRAEMASGMNIRKFDCDRRPSHCAL